MTNRELNNHPLVKFLKARRLWSEFQREIIAAGDDVKIYLGECPPEMHCLITCAFIFSETERGLGFWWAINIDWKRHLEELEEGEK